jgi:hypothetical protein
MLRIQIVLCARLKDHGRDDHLVPFDWGMEGNCGWLVNKNVHPKGAIRRRRRRLTSHLDHVNDGPSRVHVMMCILINSSKYV